MTQELVWQMFNLAGGGRLDGERSKEFIFCRVPFIEMAALARKGGVPPPPQDAPESDHRKHKILGDQIAHAESLESPRVIKTHLPISMLPPDVTTTSKVLVVMRNPKDCCA